MTSTYALSNATTVYAKALGKYGFKGAIEKFPELATGINTHKGEVTIEPVAKDTGHECKALEI